MKIIGFYNKKYECSAIMASCLRNVYVISRMKAGFKANHFLFIIEAI